MFSGAGTLSLLAWIFLTRQRDVDAAISWIANIGWNERAVLLLMSMTAISMLLSWHYYKLRPARSANAEEDLSAEHDDARETPPEGAQDRTGTGETILRTSLFALAIIPILILVVATAGILTEKRLSSIQVWVVRENPPPIGFSQVALAIEGVIKQADPKASLQIYQAQNAAALARRIGEAGKAGADVVLVYHSSFASLLDSGDAAIKKHPRTIFVSTNAISPKALAASPNLISVGPSIVRDSFRLANYVAMHHSPDLLLVQDGTSLSSNAEDIVRRILDRVPAVTISSQQMRDAAQVEDAIQNDGVNFVLDLSWSTEPLVISGSVAKQATILSPVMLSGRRRPSAHIDAAGFLSSMRLGQLPDLGDGKVPEALWLAAYPLTVAIVSQPVAFDVTKTVSQAATELAEDDLYFGPSGQLNYFVTGILQ